MSAEFTWTNGAWLKTEEKRRVFGGLDVIQERNDQNMVTAQYVRDGNIGGILARTSASGHSYFHYDGGGNVAALSDENGNLVGRYAYDAFGNTLEASGTRAAENPYRFSTKEHIAGMVDFGYRFYSPGMGRWLNRDPIREAGGVNLYGMVGNNPVNKIDAYGLTELDSIRASVRQAISKAVKDPQGALDDLQMLKDSSVGRGKGVSIIDKAINKVTNIICSGVRQRFDPRYWKDYFSLPRSIRNAANKQAKLLEKDPRHNSLNLEPLGGFANRWSFRINRQYRAIGEMMDDGSFIWKQITPHDYRPGSIYR